VATWFKIPGSDDYLNLDCIVRVRRMSSTQIDYQMLTGQWGAARLLDTEWDDLVRRFQQRYRERPVAAAKETITPAKLKKATQAD